MKKNIEEKKIRGLVRIAHELGTSVSHLHRLLTLGEVHLPRQDGGREIYEATVEDIRRVKGEMKNRRKADDAI